MVLNPKFSGRSQTMYQRPRPRTRVNPNLILGIIVLVVIFSVVYFLATWVLNSVSTVGVSGPTNMSIAQATPTIFTVSNGEYSARLISASASTGSAVIELVRSPAFVNQAMRVTLVVANATKVNGGYGKYANMEITLISIVTAGNIKVQVTPVSPTLQLAPDSGKISTAPSFLTLLSASNSVVNTTTIAATTTSTTTVSQTQDYANIALANLQSNKWYPLMLNYTKVYANDANCTSLQYNNTFQGKRGYVPTGADTYANVIPYVPYKLSYSMTNSSSTLYNAIYTAYASKIPGGSGVALYVAINASSNTLIANNTGIAWQGFTYPVLKSLYNNAVSITGACGILYYSAP